MIQIETVKELGTDDHAVIATAQITTWLDLGRGIEDSVELRVYDHLLDKSAATSLTPGQAREVARYLFESAHDVDQAKEVD